MQKKKIGGIKKKAFFKSNSFSKKTENVQN